MGRATPTCPILTPASVQPIEFESFLTALDPTGRFMFTSSGLHSATRTIVNYASNLFTGELVPVSAWPIGPFIAQSIAVTGISWPALLLPQ